MRHLMKKNPEILYTNNKGKEFIVRITSAIEFPQPYNLFRKVRFRITCTTTNESMLKSTVYDLSNEEYYYNQINHERFVNQVIKPLTDDC